MVDFFCCKILLQQVWKYFMGMSFTIIWLTPTNHSQQTKLSIHVPMHGWTADSHSFTPQVDPHRAISWHAIIGMIDVIDLLQNSLFLLLIRRLSLCKIVVISVRVDIHPAE